MPGIGIILNPHSRSNRQDPDRIKRLGFIVGDKGDCKATEDIRDLPTIIREFRERKIDILGISGGDGTNHCTLTTFIKEYGTTPLPKIAFLRGGTMNAIANNLNIHGSPEQILSNLILKYHEDQPFETTEVDLLNVNGLYGFLFGNGMLVKFVELHNKKKGGPLNVLWLLTEAVLSAALHTSFARELCERFDAEVTVDGEKWGFKNFTFLDAGTIESFSFGFKPLYRARTLPRCFQIMGCSATPQGVIAGFPRILMSQPPKSGYEDSMGRRAEIRLEHPATYMVDGDTQPPTDYIRITTGPRITVVVR